MRPKYLLASALLCAVFPGSAFATPTTLTFGDWTHSQWEILNYFNGGASQDPTRGNGPNDGIVFSSNAEELKEVSGSTSGKFENNPSGINGVLYFAFSSTSASYFNDASGFSAISFDYSLLNNLANYASTVDLYSGLNGTGDLLAQISLAPGSVTTPCTKTSPPPADEFCTWSSASASDFGYAESAVFSTSGASAPTIGQEFDRLTVSVPEPGSLLLFGSGLGVLFSFGVARRNRRLGPA